MNLMQYIAEAKRIVILGHVRPDGDCVGSCVGLYNYIVDNYREKDVQVYLQAFNKDFMFLRGADLVSHATDDQKDIDLCISLDTASMDRHGEYLCYFNQAKKTIGIDHHISNPGFCQESYIVPEACSTSEAICDLIDPERISSSAAEAFYMGIVHDTGVFKHNNTTPKAMTLAGLLIEKGARPSYVIDHTFYKKTFIQNYILGKALMEAQLSENNQCISTYLTSAFMEKANATPIDCDGIIDQLRVTEGVYVAIFAYDASDTVIKFSLRANFDVDVSKIAMAFGGGGHVKAAGFSYEGSYEDAMQKLMPMIREQL